MQRGQFLARVPAEREANRNFQTYTPRLTATLEGLTGTGNSSIIGYTWRESGGFLKESIYD